jgi:hypothetical protein
MTQLVALLINTMPLALDPAPATDLKAGGLEI